MERTASCGCGQLTIRVEGEPQLVIACSCLKCQRKTGSVLSVSSYFHDNQVLEIQGDSRSYEVNNDSGLKVGREFCPACGGTVHWKAQFLAGHTGVPVGAFADPDFPEPTYAGWGQSKHHWVTFPEHCKISDTQKFE
jgi:hypothetical protein